MAERRVAVIGAGVGGLAAAIRLASVGARVTVWERAATVGGKLREVDVGGRPLDAGPSVLTMPFVFEELFAIAGRRMRDQISLAPVEPACRHFFPDGSRLDLFNDPARSRQAIRDFAGDANARAFDKLRDKARVIYDTVRVPFMESPVPSFADLFRPSMLLRVPQFLRIDSGRTLWDALTDIFPDPRLQKLYARYATYNGSSPFHCPATLAVILHVEQEFGIHAVRGGLYRLAEALADCARALGVEIHTGCEVSRVRTSGGRVAGLVASGQEIACDGVVANCDALQLHGHLLDGEPEAQKQKDKLARLEPSLSAYVLLARANVGDFPLVHHNVFFSRDYRREFRELVDERRPPEEPTVYVCSQDRVPDAKTPPTVDPDERHLILTNAPALDGRTAWQEEGPRCRERLLRVLERSGLKLRPTAETAVLPTDLERLFPASRGSIYGAASNSKLAAFERPPNRVAGFRNLYLVGGSAHPGAGMPMVALSAKIACAQAARDLGLPAPAPRAATPGGTSTR